MEIFLQTKIKVGYMKNLKAGRPFLILIIMAALFGISVKGAAQEGFRIAVDLDTFSGNEIYLAYYFGKNQYVRDTAARENDLYVFEADTLLEPGVYMVVLPPDNRFFQVLLPAEDQTMDFKADPRDLNGTLSINGSAENSMFYDYLGFLNEERPLRDSLSKLYQEATDEEVKASYLAELEGINDQVMSRQEALVRDHPESVTALMINSGREVEIPEFEGEKADVDLKRYVYFKDHYFDYIDFNNPALLRTPFLHNKIDYYVNKLTVQVPDSISKSLDFVLNQFEQGGEGFRYYLIHFLNTYASSKIVGMDAVYVHIVDKYYAKGLASWTDQEQLDKIIKNAETLKPILIGKKAPDLVLLDQKGTEVRLSEVDAEYTVLFFWDPDCGHCKKSIPGMVEFQETYREKGIKVIAVCTALQDEVSKCWDSVEERNMDGFLNLVDPYMRSRYKIIYDVKSTPQIFILDREKTIVVKRIGAEQLPEVLDQLMGLHNSETSKS